jgi:hypothetical protein
VGDNDVMRPQGNALDRTTQAWVRATGRHVHLAEHPWLDGPVGDPNMIGGEWLSREAERLHCDLADGGGLMVSFDALRSDGFDPSAPAPEIPRFGDDGAYLIARGRGDSVAVRRVPLAEQFRVYVDDEGTLRTDHSLSLWTIPTLRFHYRLERGPPAPERSF